VEAESTKQARKDEQKREKTREREN